MRWADGEDGESTNRQITNVFIIKKSYYLFLLSAKVKKVFYEQIWGFEKLIKPGEVNRTVRLS